MARISFTLLTSLTMPSTSCTHKKNAPTSPSLRNTVANQKKNFGLCPESFNQLVHELRRGNRILYEQVFLAHFEDCMKYLQRKYKASYNDAYDISMETMLLFMNRLKSGKATYGNLRFLFTQMAGQLFFKYIKKIKLSEEFLFIEVEEESKEEQEELYLIIEQVWEKLDKEQQSLLRAFYYDGIPFKELAAQTGISAVTLRKRKQRSMDFLKKEVLKGHRNNKCPV